MYIQVHTHEIYDIASGVIVGSSALYSCLPPIETFDDFPRFKKLYKAFTLIVLKIASINLRSILYPQIKSLGNANDAAAIESRIEQSSVEEPLPDPAPPKKALPGETIKDKP